MDHSAGWRCFSSSLLPRYSLVSLVCWSTLLHVCLAVSTVTCESTLAKQHLSSSAVRCPRIVPLFGGESVKDGLREALFAAVHALNSVCFPRLTMCDIRQLNQAASSTSVSTARRSVLQGYASGSAR